MNRGRSRPGSRPPSPLPRAGRGGGVGADIADVAPTPPSPSLLRKGGESRSEPPGANLVLLGEFGRAHGLNGEVRLKSFTADPLAIASYNPLIADGGRPVTLKSVRQAPGGVPDLLIARVEGVSTRESAEALNRMRLHLDRDKLPPPDDDEFLLADLIGLAVHDSAGAVLGAVVAVPNYGGGDLLEIRPASGGATALLPFTLAFVPEVDLAGRRVVVNAPGDLFAPATPLPDAPEDGA